MKGRRMSVEAREARQPWILLSPALGADQVGFYLDNWQKALSDRFYRDILLNTLKIAAITTLICGLMGYPAAYFIARSKGNKRILLLLLMLPFWISYIIRTMSWINILGTSGALNTLLMTLGIISEPMQMLYNEATVILGLVHFLLPFMVLNVYVSLEGIDTNLEDAATSLGATRWQAFLQVTLPLSLPGLAAGGLLCFVLGAGTYITPVILGGPRDAMFANLVFEAIITQLNWPLGSALSLLLLIVLGLPVAVVVLLSFNANQFGSFPMSGVSLRWFEELWNNDAVMRAFRTSIVLGLMTAVISTTLGILASLALVRYKIPGRNTITTLLIAPILVPEVVLAVALLLFLNWLGLGKSFALLLAGHVIFTLPFVILVVQARLVSIKRDVEEAALSLGASPVQTFFSVTLPLMLPAVAAGALFAFTISFDDITGTLFWKPGGVETVPTQIFSMLRNSISPEINALGTVMIVMTVGLPLLGAAVARKLAMKSGT